MHWLTHPVEMNFFLPQFRALFMAENANATMHNLLPARGALVRDAKAIVVGGIEDATLRSFLGYDIGVAITGSEKKGLTVVTAQSIDRYLGPPKVFKDQLLKKDIMKFFRVCFYPHQSGQYRRDFNKGICTGHFSFPCLFKIDHQVKSQVS